MNSDNIDYDDVMVWLGSDNTLKCAVETIRDIANGEYNLYHLKSDIGQSREETA